MKKPIRVVAISTTLLLSLSAWGGVAFAADTTTASNGLNASEQCSAQTEALDTDYPKPPLLTDRACVVDLSKEAAWSYNSAEDFSTVDGTVVTPNYSADKITLDVKTQDKPFYLSPANSEVQKVQRDLGIIEVSLNVTKLDGELGFALAMTDTNNYTELRNDGTGWKLVGKKEGTEFSHNLNVTDPVNNTIPTGKIQYRIEYRVINNQVDFLNKRKDLSFLTLKKRSDNNSVWETIGDLKASANANNTNVKAGKLGLYVKSNSANGVQLDVEKLGYNSYTLEKRAETEKLINDWSDSAQVNADQKDNLLRYINNQTGENVGVVLSTINTRTLSSIKSAQDSINTYTEMPAEVKEKMQKLLDTHGVALSTLTYQADTIEETYKKSNEVLAKDKRIREAEGAYTLSPQNEQEEYDQALAELKEKVAALTAVSPEINSEVDISAALTDYPMAYEAVEEATGTITILSNKLEVNTLPNLSDEEKAKFKEQIAQAGANPDPDTAAAEMAAALEAAKAKDAENLSNLKTKALEEIDKLSDLTTEQKQAFKDQINSETVKTEQAINAIVAKAQELAPQMKALREETAKKDTIKAPGNKQYEEASSDKKAAYDNALAKAESLVASGNTTDASVIAAALKALSDSATALDGEKNAKIKEATAAVEAAEAAPSDETKYEQADKLVATIDPGAEKTALEKRLETVKALAEAEKAVAAAEKMPEDQALLEAAEAKVKALPEDKQPALQTRLDKIKADNAEKAALEAVEKALEDPSNDNIAAAKKALEAVSAPEKQKELNTRLAPALEANQAEVEALAKAKAAQKDPNAENIAAAEQAHNDLKNEHSKERVKIALDQAVLAGAKQALSEAKSLIVELVEGNTKDTSMYQAKADLAALLITKLPTELQADLPAELDHLNALAEAVKKVISAESDLAKKEAYTEAKDIVGSLDDSTDKTVLNKRLELVNAKGVAIEQVAKLGNLSTIQSSQADSNILAATSVEAVESALAGAVELDKAVAELKAQIALAEEEQAKVGYPEFTADSRAKLAEQLAKAKELLNQADLKVEAVTLGIEDLKATIAGLELTPKDNGNASGNINPGTGAGNPSTNQNGADANSGAAKGQNPSVAVNAQINKLSNTGINACFLASVLLSLSLGAAILYSRRRQA